MFTHKGHRVTFQHGTRVLNDRHQEHYIPCEIKGTYPQVKRLVTSCLISSLNGHTLYKGHSILNPLDQFDRNRGRKLAMAAALEGISRNEREGYWEKYFDIRHKPYLKEQE